MVSKKQGIAIGLIILILSIGGVVFYYFFPHIWGSALYPLRYQDIIVKYASEYEMEPTFIAGIVYAESHYNPQAVSRVGAKGLMQLMPATAQGISKQLGEEKMGDLFDPEANIRYGTFYIAQKYRDFGNSKEAALAAYNGGPAVGSRYVVSRDAGIPKETQNFIRVVTAAQSKYTELYGQNLDTNVAEKLRAKQDQATTWIQKLFSIFKL